MRGDGITIVYLTRHGETDWNHEKRIQGQINVPLNDRGNRQAEALAERLSTIDLDVICTSDLRRSLETAERIAARQPRGAPMVTMPELRECSYGLWEGLTRAEVADRFAEDWENWNQRRFTESPTGGESFLSLFQRAGRAFDAAVQKGEKVLIAAHRGTLRAILCHALQLDPARRDQFLVMNCSLTVLECLPGCRPRLVLLDDTSHLTAVPPAIVSGTGLSDSSDCAGSPGPLSPRFASR
ncbi:MAG: histidine phosphatase family protein [Thermodesulfobacteriota bacterium]